MFVILGKNNGTDESYHVFFHLFSDVGSCKYWLASGSNEFSIHVHDLSSVLGTIVIALLDRTKPHLI